MMKQLYQTCKWALCIMIGLNVSIAIAHDTTVVCLPSGFSLKQTVERDFANFRRNDSIRLMNEMSISFPPSRSYTISYDNSPIAYTSNNEPVNSNGGFVVQNLKNLVVICRISCSRDIDFRFENEDTVEIFPGNTGIKACLKDKFFNTPAKFVNEANGNINAEFVWTKVYVIRKPLTKSPVIIGDCFTNKITLTVLDEFSDMNPRWHYDQAVWRETSKNNNSMSLALKVSSNSVLTSEVSYTVSDCIGRQYTMPKTIKNNTTPKPTISNMPTCLPVNLAGNIEASVTSVHHNGMLYKWSFSSPAVSGSSINMATPAASANRTYSVNLNNAHEWNLSVTASGGCLSSSSDVKRITRKLGSNVLLKIIGNENCLEEGDIIKVYTEPSMPNLRLAWTFPNNVVPVSPEGNDYKNVRVSKRTGILGGTIINVQSASCPPSGIGDPSVRVKSLDAKDQIRLQARIEGGRVLDYIDSVPIGTKVIFEPTPREFINECRVASIVAILKPFPFLSPVDPVVNPAIVAPSYTCTYTAFSPSSWYGVTINTSTCKGNFQTQYKIFSRKNSVVGPPVIDPPVIIGGSL